MEKNHSMVKCGNCEYVGPGLKNRSLWAQIVSWILVVISPLITMFYYILNPRYKCPKCKSDFIGIQDEEGVYRRSGNTAVVLFVVLGIFMSIAIIGILSSIVLASLSVARENGSVLSATTTTSTTTMKIDASKKISQSSVEAVVKYVKNNTKFPKKIDENTTWTSVAAEPNLFIRYNYVVNDLNLEGITSDDLKGLILNDVCSNPDVKDRLLDKGVTARYVYTITNSTKVFDFNVDASDCK